MAPDERLDISGRGFHGRVVLKGREEPDLVVYRSVDLDEMRSVAETVAGVLGWRLAKTRT